MKTKGGDKKENDVIEIRVIRVYRILYPIDKMK
jgi:hypothetical protein